MRCKTNLWKRCRLVRPPFAPRQAGAQAAGGGSDDLPKRQGTHVDIGWNAFCERTGPKITGFLLEESIVHHLSQSRFSSHPCQPTSTAAKTEPPLR